MMPDEEQNEEQKNKLPRFIPCLNIAALRQITCNRLQLWLA
jgi:hypothetical protein